MKIAIMQPYFMPYLGYFQLIAHADVFVVYDDVNYIKQGWINRNRLLVNGKPHLVTVPVQNGRSSVRICDVRISNRDTIWREKLLKTVRQSYAKAPGFSEIYSWFEDLIQSDIKTICELNLKALRWIRDYLRLRTALVESSRKYENEEMKRAERLADICLQEGADHYINLVGGRELYEQSMFTPYGLKLSFHEASLPSYPQNSVEFIPALSILDVLMWNSRGKAVDMVHEGTVSG